MTLAEEFVVLLDERGGPIGRQRKSQVHHAETPLHLAFSVHIFDSDGRVLLTRRALGKRTWPGVWTNSCCGHPAPGEPMLDAIARRLDYELGIEATGLRCALPDFRYRTRDVTGIWENEICPVYTGQLVHPGAASRPNLSGIRPNPAEVCDWAWADWDEVVSAMASTPFAFSPWAVQQVQAMAGERPTGPNRDLTGGSA